MAAPSIKEDQNEPTSPSASITTFASCSTLNHIANIESRPSYGSTRSAVPSQRGSIESSRTGLSSEPQEEAENLGDSRSLHSTHQSTRSSRRSFHHSSIHSPPRTPIDDDNGSQIEHVIPIEPNSPSNSDEPVLRNAASFAGAGDQDDDEKRLTTISSRTSGIQSMRKDSSQPTDSTVQSYRDDEDAISMKSRTSNTNALPILDNYPPQSNDCKIDGLAPPDGGLRAWLNVVGGFLVLFATFGYTNAFGVYQAYYKQTIFRQYSNSSISWIGSVQLCLFFLLALVAGPLFDKGQFRILIAVGSACQISSVFLIPQCTEFWQVMLVQGLLSGIGIGLCFLPALSVQSHWFLRRRAFAIGIVTSGSSLGGIAFPIMLNKLFVNPSFGYTDGVRASGYVIAACLVIANLIMAPHPARLVAHKPPLPSLRKIMTPTFCCMTFGALLLNFGLWLPLFYLAVLAQYRGVSQDLSFYTLAIYNAGSFFGRTIPNLAADYLGPQNIQSFCCVSAGIALYCMYICESAASIVTFAAVYGALSGGFISLVSPAIISISDDISEIGLRQGVAFIIVAGGAVGGNPICGKLAELGPRTDPFLAPIMFAATMALLGGIVTTVGRFLRAKEKGTWKV